MAKQVFSNHPELAHVWAAQSQQTGRAGNMFFDGADIFSYGRHFTAARIYDGGRFALVNSYRYSVSTGAHLRHVQNALRGRMPFFDSPDVTDPQAALVHLQARAKAGLEELFTRRTVKWESTIENELMSVHLDYSQLNELARLIGAPEVWPADSEYRRAEMHLRARLARFKELNTPEMLAKKEAKARKRKELEEAAQRKALAKQIDAFRSGEAFTGLGGLHWELLRVKGGEVETSRHARVPLDSARKLFDLLRNGAECVMPGNKRVTLSLAVGQSIGAFRVNQVLPLENGDIELTVGCHRILYSEAAQVLGAL